MLHTRFYQRSFLELDPDAIGLPANSFERHLRELLPRIVAPEDFDGFYHDTLGTSSCCPIILTGMLMLQYRYSLTDPELVDRCNRDLGFKCALRMTADQSAYSVSSVRRHRTKVRERLGEDFIHKRVLRLVQDAGLLDDADLQGIDSTNTDCRGAVIDTYNLVAAAIKQVIRGVAACLDTRPEKLAEEWDLARYLRRSIKGGVNIDWNNKDKRDALITEEIRHAEELVTRVEALQLTLPEDISEAIQLMLKVAHQDVKKQDDGAYTIVQGTAPGRVISIADPEARHGHKTQRKVINGFKTHVMGTLHSQFVTGITVTDASVHDSEPTEELILQGEEADVGPSELVGDCAYGTGANRQRCRERGVEIRAKAPVPSIHTALGKHLFEIDFENMTLTCPAGQTTGKFTLVKDPDAGGQMVPNFKFHKDTCQACIFRDKCNSQTRNGGGRRVRLSGYEKETREARAYNSTTSGKEALRARSAIERLISHLVKMGMRHARFFGMYMVQFQAFMTAAAYNLQRYITLSCQRR